MRKILYHPLIVVIITIISLLIFISLTKSSHRTQKTSQQIRLLEEEVNRTSINIAKLEDELTKTDSQLFKEKIIRNELLLQKPTEKVIILPDNKVTQDSKKVTREEEKIITKWLKLLM